MSSILNQRTQNLRGEPTSTPPSPTKAPPSTPRKTKAVLPQTQSAMTVSVTQSQQITITTSSTHSVQTNPPTMAALTMTQRPTSPSNSSGSETDVIVNTNASTALRRLYFKSAKATRNKAATSTVPKVVVMGSSTTSEATINTSTESASTHITNMTTTDTETLDSLDLGDLSGQCEPLLSSIEDEQIVMSHNAAKKKFIESSVDIDDDNVDDPDDDDDEDESNTIMNGPDTPLLINYQDMQMLTTTASGTTAGNAASSSMMATPNNYYQMPRTAPVTSSTRFQFDPPRSPKSVRTYEKNHTLFTFEQETNTAARRASATPTTAHTAGTSPAAAAAANLNTHKSNKQSSDSCENKENKTRNDNILIKHNHINSNLMNKSNKTSTSHKDDSDNMNNDTELTILSPSAFGSDRSARNADIAEYTESSSARRQPAEDKHRHKSYNKKSVPQHHPSPQQSAHHQQQAQQHHHHPHRGHHTHHHKKINSAPAMSKYQKQQQYDTTDYDTTMFPFDREAIDYERIQRECFAVEEEMKFPFYYDDSSDDQSCGGGAIGSPSDLHQQNQQSQSSARAKCSSPNEIFQQYAILSQQEREKLPSERPRSKSKQRHSSDAFASPKYDKKIMRNLSKFDQIVSIFDQIPSKSGTGASSSSAAAAPLTNTNAATATGGTTRATPPLPDLRIDFFTETNQNDILESCQKVSSSSSSSLQVNSGGGGGGVGGAGASTSAAGVGTGAGASGVCGSGSINVTSNPMETAVCTQPPRATIVVQQASLSLDYSVETVLLKNEGDFISVEQGKELSRKKKQREENMRQLLDVTNTLTQEEIRDFEMRYGSPHHSRSQSVKTPGSRASGRPNQLCLPQQRSRVASMPNTGVEEEYYRLRHFSITGKGVINRGDSLKSRRSRSNNSVASSNSSTEHLTAIAGGSARTSATCSLASSRESSTSNPGHQPYRVLMLGGTAVGKSSLVSQFMTSEYLHAYDTSIDDESGEKSVSVLLSGEESELTFIDHGYSEMSPENCLSSYDPNGYCVIYSSADKNSFLVAERILQALWTSENIAQKAVILVANKADLARSRTVSSEEGKAMATAYDCKFIETSVGINHNVDELLVGLLSQIRLKLENPEKTRDLFRKRSYRKSKRRACSPLGGTICLSGNAGTNPSTPVSIGPLSGNDIANTPPGSVQNSPRKYRGSRTSASLKVKGLLGRVWARDSKSKSCENLHVL